VTANVTNGGPLALQSSGGNVGIGNTSPATFLDIKGNNVGYIGQLRLAATDYDQITFYNSGALTANGTNRLGALYYDIANTAIDIQNFSGNDYLLLNPGGGNVGVGNTSPSDTLSVTTTYGCCGNNAIGAYGNVADVGVGIKNQTAGGRDWRILSSGTGSGVGVGNFNIYDNSGGGTRFSINSSGYVGINTTSPSYTLDVSGNTYVTGVLGVGVAPNGGYGIHSVLAQGSSAQAIRGENSVSGGIGVLGYNSADGSYGWMGGGGWGVYCVNGTCGGNQAWTNNSDIRLKTAIRDLPGEDGLAAIVKLRPVRFHWKDKEQDARQGEKIGFIAQEVEKVFPEAVTTASTDTTIDLGQGKKEVVKNTKTLAYSDLTAPLVKAVQELKHLLDGVIADVKKLAARMDEAFTKLAAHDGEIKELKADNDNLKAANDNLAAEHTADAKAIDELRHEVADLKREIHAR
jgi:hypothetical protein